MKTKQMPNHLLLDETACLIAKGYTVVHVVRGNSMNPFLIDRKDRVLLASFEDDELKPGALVLAKDSTDRYVLHRILHRKDDNLVLMGDGNLRGKERSNIHQVAGIVTKIIKEDKVYPCNGRIWKIYSYIWVRIRPLRRILLAVWRRVI